MQTLLLERCALCGEGLKTREISLQRLATYLPRMSNSKLEIRIAALLVARNKIWPSFHRLSVKRKKLVLNDQPSSLLQAERRFAYDGFLRKAFYL